MEGSTVSISVVRRDDGLWMEFTRSATISIEAILEGRGPIVSKIAREVCETLAEDRTSKRSEIEYQALQRIGER